MGRVVRNPDAKGPAGDRPLVALAMIVRNEERALAACLESARAFVDEIVVVDTGSTDGTVAIAERYGARIGTFAWCDDFAAARNAALDLVTARWVLHLDADEQLEAPRDLRVRLERLPDATWAVETAVVSLDATGERRRDQASFQKRIFRSEPHIRFERPIHEEVVNPRGGVRARWANTTVWHYGYADETVRRAKIDRRNRPILERAHEDDPTNAVYGLQLAILQPDVDTGLALYEKVRAGADRVTRRSELFLMATVRMVERLRDAGRLADAINLATTVFVEDPTPDITVLLGQLLVLVGELERAQAILKIGLDLPADTTSRFITGSASWLPRLALGEIARRQRRYSEGASYVKKAIALHPDPAVVAPRLAIFYALAGEWPAAATAIGERRRGGDEAALLATAARRAFEQRDLAAALDGVIALQATRTDAGDARLHAELLVHLGDKGSALRILTAVANDNPTDLETWLALAELDTGPAGVPSALNAARKATDLEPRSSQAWSARAHLELTVRDNPRAAESAEQALAFDPHDERAILARTRALTRLGAIQDAYDLVFAAAATEREGTVYTRALSEVLEQAGEFDEALTVLSKAIDAHPQDAELFAHLGNVLGRVGRYEDALNAFELAVARGASPAVLNDAMKYVAQAARKAGVEPVSPVRAVFQGQGGNS